MQYITNAKEMKEYDRVTIEEYGMPSMVLMERAALQVVRELQDGSFNLSKVLVVCGSGNNGGDGFAVARLLRQNQIETAVVFAGKEESLTEETRIQKKICEKYGMNICSNFQVGEYTCIVDAIFGIGLSREIQGKYRELIEKINASNVDVVAVDIPSGISADTGKVMGVAVCARKTVTFAFPKLGQILYPGAQWCGEVKVCQIGITKESMKGTPPYAYRLDEEDLKDLPGRYAHSNKGTYGKALMVAGQHNMCGAACLAGEAAYRMGTGLVRIVTEECNRVIVQSTLPEALLSTYDSENFQQNLEELLYWPTAAGIGPGFGTTPIKGELLKLFMRKGKGPLVLDADALNLLSGNMSLLKECTREIVVTPHIGEMARLTGLTKAEILEDVSGVCRSFAKEFGVICVLKDARTVISDGKEICINCTGGNGMATGGSGDVLTGMITGLLAQGMDPFKAAKLAVYIHGRAGELAEKKCGPRGMLAGDILKALPEILK